MGGISSFLMLIERVRWVSRHAWDSADRISAMAYGLVQIKNTALAPWQLVFVVEAAVSNHVGNVTETSQLLSAVSWSFSSCPTVPTNVAS
jgi:hypothetical protein